MWITCNTQVPRQGAVFAVGDAIRDAVEACAGYELAH
jgi:hypothetical protein